MTVMTFGSITMLYLRSWFRIFFVISFDLCLAPGATCCLINLSFWGGGVFLNEF
jgi:hypothetical protein